MTRNKWLAILMGKIADLAWSLKQKIKWSGPWGRKRQAKVNADLETLRHKLLREEQS